MKTRVLLVFALIAVVSPACWALGTTRQTTTSLVFNFDSGSPALSPGRPTPFNQTVANVTATFSSILDPSAFSVQRYETTFFVLSEFSGNYLYDNKLATRSVDIRFDANLTSIEFAFATVEYHGGAASEPSNLTLTAYLGAVGSTPVGKATNRGTWPEGNSFPQGRLSFDSAGQPFNLVRIELPFQGPQAASDFLLDNITVKTISSTVPGGQGGGTTGGTTGGTMGGATGGTTGGDTGVSAQPSQETLMAISLAAVAILAVAVLVRARGR